MLVWLQLGQIFDSCFFGIRDNIFVDLNNLPDIYYVKVDDYEI